MNDNITFSLLVFTSFFTIINPLGVMPVFMTMTAEFSRADRRFTAKKAVLTAFLTLLFFAFSGQLLFQFFGISADSFRVVGGIIFFLMGQDMLQARLSKAKVTNEEIKEYVTDISITPLAIPMLCGPGAITNAIVLMENAKDWLQQALMLSVAAFVLLLTYLILLSSGKLTKMLGVTGNKVLLRLMGLIVMVIAVEVFFSGLGPILKRALMG